MARKKRNNAAHHHGSGPQNVSVEATALAAKSKSKSSLTEPLEDYVEDGKAPVKTTEDEEDSDTGSIVEATIKHAGKKKRQTGLVLFIGGLMGVILAMAFLNHTGTVDFESLTGSGFEALADILPPSMLADFKSFSGQSDKPSLDSFSVGLNLRKQGVEAHFPVIMVPGVISTGLESWSTTDASRPYFRKRMWGSSTMFRCLVLDRALWKRHIMLNHTTGLDPEGIKLRAAQGFDATDFFITGYWIWNKIIENLSTIGYDPTNSYTAAYDWRLSYMNLEIRDQYFTRLKAHIEMAVHIHKRKAIIVSHSMGSQVVFWFFKWVEAEGHGNGGRDWVEKHIDSFINISGSMLGAVKGFPAVLSGEMKDTAQLNQVAVYGLERFFGREERAEIMRSMPGISSMLPKGGDAVWGNLTWAPDDQPGQKTSYGNFIKFKYQNDTKEMRNLTVDGALDYLLESTEPWFKDMVLGSYSHGLARTDKEVKANEHDPVKWVNPLEARLPHAPSMKLYCLYGVGKSTERSYFYRQQALNSSILHATIDTTVLDGNTTDHGIVTGEGDGTVSLLSQGFMCEKGWKTKRFNPAGIKIKVVEMLHEPLNFDMRGGPQTADHVDILGRPELNELILRIAAGKGDEIKENIVSNIKLYSDRIDLD